MIEDNFPSLQFQPTKIQLDEKVAEAKAKLLNSIKKSVYIYRVDCGGCNGCEIEIFATIMTTYNEKKYELRKRLAQQYAR